MRDGPLAQLVEQGTFNPKVAGSIPSRPTMRAIGLWCNGSTWVFGTLSQGSNPCRPAIIYKRHESGVSFFASYFKSSRQTEYAEICILMPIYALKIKVLYNAMRLFILSKG